MKVLMQELNDILAEKNSRIAILEWENQSLKKENEELKKDNEKLMENEAKRYE